MNFHFVHIIELCDTENVCMCGYVWTQTHTHTHTSYRMEYANQKVTPIKEH